MTTRAGDKATDWREDLRHARRTSQSFYRDLLGWAYTPDRGHGEASELSTAGRERIQQGPVSLPSKWVNGEERRVGPKQVWVRVDDVEETVERATELGAQVQIPPLNVQGVGRIATVLDPMGSLVSLIQYAA